MSVGYNPKIVTGGLVMCLDAANPKSYPGSGTTWTDLSGKNNNGTLANGPTYNNNFGGVIATDGVDDFISTPQISGTGSSTLSQSYCLWVKPNDTAGNILSMSNLYPQNGWNMPPISAESSRFTGKFWSNQRLTAVNTYTNLTWYYVCVVFYYDTIQANSYQRLYVNGILQAEQTNITYSSSGSDNFIFLGQQNPGADNAGMFAGDYGAIQIYTGKALSAAEVQQNFNALRGRYGI
jgi:hypothetical protein